MTDQGAFATGEFSALLRKLLDDGAVGRLDVTAGGTVRKIHLSGGRVRAVVSENEEERLGRWLAGRELVETQRMLLALLKQRPGRLLGAQLVEDGLLGGAALGAQLKARAADLVAKLILDKGTWVLRGGEGLPDDSAALDLDLGGAELLLEAGRACELEQLSQAVLRSGRVVHVVEGSLEHSRNLPLSQQEGFVLSRVGKGMTLDGLVRLMPSGAGDVRRAVGTLVVAGLVEFGEKVAADAPKATAHEKKEEKPRLSPEQLREAEDISRLAAELRFRDFYRLLGLSRGATQDQVHGQFRERARVYNPERVSEEHLRALRKELTDIQSALQEAYRTLIQPERRSRYDKLLKEGDAPVAGQMESEDRRELARRELVEANLRRVQELIQVGEVGEAIQLLDQAVRFDPQPETLLLLAQLERRNPMWSQRALDRLKRALTIDPRYTDAWLELSSFWGARNHTARQRDCLKKILEYDPNNQEVKTALSKLTSR